MNFAEGEILYFDKPLHWTSFQLVNKIKYSILRHQKIKKLKVGHAGTLDPLATGVMIVCTGKSTKQIESYQFQTKEYIATLKLGATTPSFDLEHEVDKEYSTEHITLELVEKVLGQFTGKIQQTPPIFSAVKVNGKRAFNYAREGLDVNLQAKTLVIDEIEILSFSLPILKIKVICSKGTYIRALARDIGFALQSGAHLIALQRTRIGEITLSQCLKIDDFIKGLDTTI